MNAPGNARVSILIPCKDDVQFLSNAVTSCFQNELKEIEVLVIDDFSEPPLSLADCGAADPRIRLLRNRKDPGLVNALNFGLQESNGQFIARLDADDVSAAGRIDAQKSFLEENCEVALVGGWASTFGFRNEEWQFPRSEAALRSYMRWSNPFVHSSVMINRGLVAPGTLVYSDLFPLAEDYELWLRIALVHRVAVLPRVLVYHQLHDAQFSRTSKSLQKEAVRRLEAMRRQVLRLVSADRGSRKKKLGSKLFWVDAREISGLYLVFAERLKRKSRRCWSRSLGWAGAS